MNPRGLPATPSTESICGRRDSRWRRSGKAGRRGRFWLGAGWMLGLGLGLAAAAETRWFPGTQRMLPPALAAFKEDGIASQWSRTSNDETVWDLNLGTDMCIWERVGEEWEQTLGGRFGIAGRFEFGSESFDLWAVDFRGGAAWGVRRGPWVGEAFLFHESSHLGDEIVERGDRSRQDVAVNGVRLTASREWEDRFRLYGGVLAVPFAEPEPLRSVGLQLGGAAWHLPPARRGYVAFELETWEWRGWSPDITVQAGVFLATRAGEGGALLSRARAYLEMHTGRVRLGQFHDETESSIGAGLALYW